MFKILLLNNCTVAIFPSVQEKMQVLSYFVSTIVICSERNLKTLPFFNVTITLPFLFFVQKNTFASPAAIKVAVRPLQLIKL